MYLRRAQWVTDKYIWIMLGVFPLFCGFRVHAYTAVTGAKFHFFIWAACLWLGTVAALLLLGALKGERYSLTVRPAHLAVAVFLAMGAVSAAASDYGAVCLMGADRYDGYIPTALCGAVFYGVSFLGRPRRRYAWALGVSAGICCGIALLQLCGLDPFRLYPEGLNYYDKYEALNAPFLGTIGNSGILAAYLCLAAPILVIFPLLSERRVDKLLLLPGGMALAVLALCDVDAGLAAAAGCAVISVPMILRRRKAARIAAGASAGLTAAGLGTLFLWPGAPGTLGELSQVLHGHLADEFGSHRGEIWKHCWRLFWEKPWLGGGPGTASRRIDIRWSRYIEALGRDRVVAVGNTHNVYLGYLISWGAVAAAAYIAAAACSMVTWFRRRKLGALYPALGSALLCYLIQDFFGLGLVLTAPMLWVVWGLLETGDEEAGPADETA